jgi:hypothetical protein
MHTTGNIKKGRNKRVGVALESNFHKRGYFLKLRSTNLKYIFSCKRGGVHEVGAIERFLAKTERHRSLISKKSSRPKQHTFILGSAELHESFQVCNDQIHAQDTVFPNKERGPQDTFSFKSACAE